jgi:hypothetical protein
VTQRRGAARRTTAPFGVADGRDHGEHVVHDEQAHDREPGSSARACARRENSTLPAVPKRGDDTARSLFCEVADVSAVWVERTSSRRE